MTADPATPVPALAPRSNPSATRQPPRRGRAPARRRPPTTAPPGPAWVAHLFVRCWLEVAAGRRPPEQLAPLVTRDVLHGLRNHLGPLPLHPLGAARVVGATTVPAGDRHEAVVRVQRERGQSVVALVLVPRPAAVWLVDEVLVLPSPGGAQALRLPLTRGSRACRSTS